MLPQSFSTFHEVDHVSFDSCIMMKHLNLYIYTTFLYSTLFSSFSYLSLSLATASAGIAIHATTLLFFPFLLNPCFLLHSNRPQRC